MHKQTQQLLSAFNKTLGIGFPQQAQCFQLLRLQFKTSSWETMDNKAVDRWTAEVQDSLHADDDIKQETVTTNESLCSNTSTGMEKD